MSNLLFPEDFYKVKLFATGGDLVIEQSIIYETVSYTHLDVYKRQMHGGVRFGVILIPIGNRFIHLLRGERMNYTV